MIKIFRKNRTILVTPEPKGLYDAIGYYHKHYQADAEWKALGRSKDEAFSTLPGLYSMITQWLISRNIEFETVDERTRLEWNISKVDLDSQRESAIKLLNKVGGNENGILVGPCGMGKTHVIKGLIQGFDARKILITTDDIGAAIQLHTDLERLLPDREIGILCSKKKTPPRPITIVTVDSLRALAGHIQYAKAGLGLRDFELWIGDEAHTIPTPTTLAHICKIYAPTRYGLTATPTRKDGAQVLLEGYFGPVLEEVTYAEGVEMGNVAPINLYIFPVPFIDNVCKLKPEHNDWRIPAYGIVHYRPLHYIISEISKKLPKDGAHLIFAQWRKYCQILQKSIPKAKILHSKLGDGFIAQVKKDLKERKDVSVIATDMIQKAFDAPNIKYITMASLGSISDRVQRTGRATRIKDGKTHAQIHDFLYLHHPVLCQSSLTIIEEYAKLGWNPKLLMDPKDLLELSKNPILYKSSKKILDLEKYCTC